MSQSPLVLYVETNFLMSIATGRDPDASDILTEIGSPDRLALPQVCFMEAFSVLNEMRRSRNQFRNQLDQQIGELRRDSTSAHARDLLSLLERARVASNKLIEDIDMRLFSTVSRLSRDAELIGLTGEILDEQQKTILVEDPTDNLVLHCILAHAREHPAEDKVFLTGDRKAFGEPKVQDELRIAGVTKTFWEGKQFRMWFASQPRS
jgi:hypothetical protein